ncbi:MAG: AI-2E family transporter [Clostridia bacterium]|nr:AI-2E family transporter [Clostridia bacterium]
MKVNKNVGQWIGLFLLGTCLIIVYKTFDNLGAIGDVLGNFLSILTPFIVGFAIAFLLYAPVKKLDGLFCRCKWKFMQRIARPLAVFIVYVLALAIVALVVYAAIPALITAISDFAKNLPAYYNKVLTLVSTYTAEGGLLEGLDVESKLQEIYTMLQQYLTVDRVLSYLGSVVRFATSLLDVVMAFIVSVYMLLSKEALVRALKSVCALVFKPKTMNFFSVYLNKTATIFYNYFYSQAIDALVVGVLATIGFLLARLPNAPVLGMMLGLMNMIPYFGALIGGVVCVLVALLAGNFYGALFVAIYILVMQQLDANIIQPRIVGQTVGLRPIYVLLGITIGGGLYGFWGIFLGVPVMAVIQMLITDYIAARNEAAVPETAKQ